MALLRINQEHQTDKAPKVARIGDEIRIDWSGATISMPTALAGQLEAALHAVMGDVRAEH